MLLPEDQKLDRDAHSCPFTERGTGSSRADTREKETKGPQIGKEVVKLSRSEDYLLLCIENPSSAPVGMIM